MEILRQQTEISKIISERQEQSTLPAKELNYFDGTDITKFKSFLINFRRLIESKCLDNNEKLVYLEQYTRSKAQQLVYSCIHYDPSVAYNKAVQLLIAEYGNEYAVANAYVEKIKKIARYQEWW